MICGLYWALDDIRYHSTYSSFGPMPNLNVNQFITMFKMDLKFYTEENAWDKLTFSGKIEFDQFLHRSELSVWIKTWTTEALHSFC